MHSRFTSTILLFAVLTPFASAQTGPSSDGGDGLTLNFLSESPRSFEAAWWGRTGRTYFLLHSSDLVTWEYFPTIETGQNATIRYGFASDAPRIFLRIRYEDEVYANPYALDSDGDGLTNQQELDLNLKTDLFNADTDGDGLLDKWEITHGFDPLDPSTGADSDGDKLPDVWEIVHFSNLSRDGSGHYDTGVITDKQEFLLGTKPDDAAVISTSIGLVVRNLE